MSTIPFSATHDTNAEPEVDDIEAYIATFSPEELQELKVADAAIDIAVLLHRARDYRGLTQADAAKKAGLQQQAISRFEQPQGDLKLSTLQRYLGALGFAIELKVVDPETGNAPARVVLTPGPILAKRTTRRGKLRRRIVPSRRPRIKTA